MNGLPGIRRTAAHGSTGRAVGASGGLWARGSGPTLGDRAARSARPVRLPPPGPALDAPGHHAIVRAG
ncbi:hypothetical protein [Streptomyces caelestis]|uniref:hypothetical protein n=1 Tax=Streptomyces caelestis TaxID=36816 RepID=UPI00365D5F77